MTELLNLGVSVCTGLMFGSLIAAVVILALSSAIFALGFRAGRYMERERWECIWPLASSPADEVEEFLRSQQ
jgi:hypothetical protein